MTPFASFVVFAAVGASASMQLNELHVMAPRTRSPSGVSSFVAVDALHASIFNRQSPSDCSSARLLLFVLREEQRINGFAVLFQFYAAALTLAYAYNRTLVLSAPLSYTDDLSLLRQYLNCSDERVDAARCAAIAGALRQARSASLAANDPWHRAPIAACAGASMDCFLPEPSTCSVTALTPAEAALWRARRMPRNATRHAFDNVPLIDIASEETALRRGVYDGTAARRLVRVEYLRPLRATLVRITAGAHAPAWFIADMRRQLCDRSHGVDESACSPTSTAWMPYYFATFQLYLFGSIPLHTHDDPMYRVGVHLRRGDTASSSSDVNWRPSATLQHVLHAAAGMAARAVMMEMRNELPVELIFASDSASARAFVERAPSCGLQQPQEQEGCFAYTVFTRRRVVDAVMPVDLNAHDIGFTLEPVLAVHARNAAAAETRHVQDSALGELIMTHTLAAQRQRGAVAVHETPEALILVSRYKHPTVLHDVHALYTPFELESARQIAGLTHGVVADIAALAQAHGLVGSCFSQVSRVAAELALVTGHARQWPIALDADACRAYPRHPYALGVQWQPIPAH